MVGIGIRHDLGADSLTATLLAGAAAERLGRQLPVSAVLRSGSLARLAELVGQAAGLPTPPLRQLYLNRTVRGLAGVLKQA